MVKTFPEDKTSAFIMITRLKVLVAKNLFLVRSSSCSNKRLVWV